ncbi:heme-degrading domain-containing protein [Paenibacillus daejeonensis]|uniref:heme-degrading domain-containing protein n=1 Tax=Paenibacillus daejeonensis TaxID=135193 RepID=UPI000380743C|nr:heme-degrading domain-containing protein [Paenibacillus daejeonensis]
MDSQAVLQQLLQQEENLQFETFTNDTAYELGSLIVTRAKREGKAIVVDIRLRGERVYYTRMEGKSSRNDEWVDWKNNVVQHYEHSSYYIHLLLAGRGGTVEDDGLDPEQYKAVGGAVPLRMLGEGVVGIATVSGLTGEQDHAMVAEALAELIQKDVRQ